MILFVFIINFLNLNFFNLNFFHNNLIKNLLLLFKIPYNFYNFILLFNDLTHSINSLSSSLYSISIELSSSYLFLF